MSRIVLVTAGAVAAALVLAVAVVGFAAGQAPALAAVTSPAAQAAGPAAPAASTPPPSAKPSAKPSPKPSAKPSPKAAAKPPPPPPNVPRPVSPSSPSTGRCGTGTEFEDPPNAVSVKATPWAQQALGGFAKVWQLSTGSGITVGVVDSGVDFNQQLAGQPNRVTALDETGTGTEDCVGHGTAVAGIIGASAQTAQGNPFAGIAPGAHILAVKVTNTAESSGDSQNLQAAQDTLADGIRDAVKFGATVLNISIQTGAYYPAVASAVQFAEKKGVVVVAAAGNDVTDTNNGITETGPFYPASFPGVLSVGALTPNGGLASFSDLHSNADVTAPGSSITTTEPGGYLVSTGKTNLAGTSFAAPYVAGLAALLRARFPKMTAAQVVARIEATADGNAGPGTGYGLVNPLQALQSDMAVSANPNPQLSGPGPVSVPKAVPPDSSVINAAMVTTFSSLGAAAVVVIAAAVFSQARSRRRRAAAPSAQPAVPAPADGGITGTGLW